jgi:GNAT superfamily N-acetyltransferase
MQERGKLHIVTARDEGKLVGYFASFVDYHLHYKETMMAVNDALFLDKDYRKGSLAKDMFTFAEKELKELGVKVIHLHMKVEHPFDKLCESCGYTNSERLYAKYIGE